MKDKKEKINWKRTAKNNVYMLRLIAKACPGVLILSFVSTVLAAVRAFLMHTYLYQYALNALQKGEELRVVLLTLGAMLLYSLTNSVFQTISNFYFQVKRPRVDAYIRNILHKKAAEVDLACFEDADFYDTYVKATGEATDRAYSVMNNLLEVVWAVINIGASGTLILTIDPLFLTFAVLPVLTTMLIGKRRNRLKHAYTMRTREAERKKDYVRRVFYLSDYAKEMRLSAMWKVMYKRMHDSVSEMKEIVAQYGYKMMFYRYLFDFVFDVLVHMGTIILAAFRTLVSKTMLLGDCYVVINSMDAIAGDVNYIGDIILSLDENSLYVDTLRSFLEYEVRIAEDADAPAVPAFESLTLREMSFAYAGQEKPALSRVSLCVNRGERIAIVGHNGAGKTTLVKMLMRLYDPTEGEILLNGENIKSYRLSSYRDLFGTVFQDYTLLALPVTENVLLRGGITEADRARVTDALTKAGVYGKIESLKNGVDANVTREFDKEGAMFSGGEAQKLAIARIFAGGHPIVIMDEPTSALDPIAEEEMYRGMFAACEGKAVIFISHRLSSAAMADRVYMFENGEIIEEGTHAELLRKNGRYADMWHKQADTYLEREETAV